MIVEAAKLERGDYREFRDGELRIATSLETRPGADRLTVVLNGYCDRGTSKPPVFVLWPQSAPAFGHILRVCDPTLFMVFSSMQPTSAGSSDARWRRLWSAPSP